MMEFVSWRIFIKIVSQVVIKKKRLKKIIIKKIVIKKIVIKKIVIIEKDCNNCKKIVIIEKDSGLQWGEFRVM